MIDIHTHLLPGVDDGSPNALHSAAVLERMAAQGVTGVVCTPHLNASRASAAPSAEHRHLLDGLRRIGPASIELYSGWEIMLDRFGVDLTASMLSLGASSARLVEFPRSAIPAGATEELLRLRASGIIPVVAHPERYAGCTIALLETWKELGAVMQGDATALLAAGPMSEFCRTMLAEGLIDVLASDNHGDRRSLSTARGWLEEIDAPEQADLMTRENPRRLLENRSLSPVKPVALKRRGLARLKALFFGRRRSTSREA